MRHVTEYSKQELNDMLKELTIQFQEAKKLNLKLNMARGKPAAAQLDMNMGLLEFPEGCTLEDGTDARNYGVLEGIPECRRLLGQLLGLKPDQIIIGGNSSLNLMFDTMAFHCLFGTQGKKPWSFYAYEGSPVKFLCPVPGYDRHFQICEELGIQMIPVPFWRTDRIWRWWNMVRGCVHQRNLVCSPSLHPQGVCYSDRVVDRLASMETAAPDFRIFWDNAYGVHHIYQEVPLKNILDACEAGGHPNRAYYFFSTSKITFPGAGISLIASGPDNMKEFKRHMSSQTIGHDKLNQLRHVQYFKTPENIRAHMADLAEVLRPKFDMVLNRLEEELEGSGLAVWSRPKGGYFISLDTLAGCAKRTVQLAKEAGVTLTGAGATYPYKRDPQDRNIRIAPTYPTPEELKSAMDIFILCVKIAGIESVVNQGN